MNDLNLPSYNLKTRTYNGKVEIFDEIRKKYLLLTPEEWVRQHFVNYLIDHLQYPKSLIRLEGGLTYNTLSKRSDIVVYDRKGAPFMVVECKSTNIKLSQKVVDQVAIYNTQIAAPYQVITNGLKHYCFKMCEETSKFKFLDALPCYDT